MDYMELVTSLESEAQENPSDRAGDLFVQAAEAISVLHKRASELEADVEDLLQELATSRRHGCGWLNESF